MSFRGLAFTEDMWAAFSSSLPETNWSSLPFCCARALLFVSVACPQPSVCISPWDCAWGEAMVLKEYSPMIRWYRCANGDLRVEEIVGQGSYIANQCLLRSKHRDSDGNHERVMPRWSVAEATVTAKTKTPSHYLVGWGYLKGCFQVEALGT